MGLARGGGILQAETISQAPARRTFFATSAIIMAAIVVLSFPLTYFLPVVTASRGFHILHHLHALAFFAWFGLYVWQTQLAANGKIARHREIGLTGLLITGALVPLGYWMAQHGAEVRVANAAARPFEGTWFNLIDMSLFAGFMVASVAMVTRHKEWHRRLTYVAALCLVAPAATRWTLRLPYFDPIALDIIAYLLIYPFLIALALYDRRTIGKVHAATLTSIAVLVPVHLASVWIARTAWWGGVAPVLLGPH